MNPIYAKTIIILVIFSAGIIRAVVVKLKEQAAKKRALEELEMRRNESIRTGRNLEEVRVEDPGTMRRRVEAEAAAKRQAQIEEFRRRQMERARQRSAQGSQPVPMPAPVQPAPRPAPQPAPQARPPQRQRPAKKQQPALAQPLSVQQDPVQQGHGRAAHIPMTEQETTTAAKVAAAAVARPRTPDEWRRAIVASIILSPAPAPGSTIGPWNPIG